MSTPAIPSEGLAVLHLAYGLTGDRTDAVDVSSAVALVDELAEEEQSHVLSLAILGQRADLGLLLVAPDFARLKRFERDLLATRVGARLEPRPDLSLVSVTEASEYLEDDGSEAAAERRQARLYPAGLAATRVVCWYPMAKRRSEYANWYALPFDDRKRLMYGHGRVGRSYAGRVTQLITAATGLSDWEWMVTLFSDDPKAIKDIVYEMRFDEVSHRYAEFGPFVVGLASPFADAVSEAGLRLG